MVNPALQEWMDEQWAEHCATHPTMHDPLDCKHFATHGYTCPTMSDPTPQNTALPTASPEEYVTSTPEQTRLTTASPTPPFQKPTHHPLYCTVLWPRPLFQLFEAGSVRQIVNSTQIIHPEKVTGPLRAWSSCR